MVCTLDQIAVRFKTYVKNGPKAQLILTLGQRLLHHPPQQECM